MRLVFLGRFREMAGPHLSDMALPDGVHTLAGLQDWLGGCEPALARVVAGSGSQFAINQVIVRDMAHPIKDSDEVAFLPPMSGG